MSEKTNNAVALRQMLDEAGVTYREYGGVTRGSMEPYTRYVIDGDDGLPMANIETAYDGDVMLILRCSAEHAVDAVISEKNFRACPICGRRIVE